MKNTNERRKNVRVNFENLPFTLSLIAPPFKLSETATLTRIEPKNICLGGMKLVTNYSFSLGLELQFWMFTSLDGKSNIKLSGHVVRLEKYESLNETAYFGVAIQFSDDSKKQLAVHIPVEFFG